MLKLTPESFRKMLWKNGRGETLEILVEPKGSATVADDFIWRLSSARVNEAGPFSIFPKCERLLLVTAGVGLRLNGDLLEPLHIKRFSGELAIDCEPLSRGVVDLGLIWRSDRVDAAMKVIKTKASNRALYSPVCKWFILTVLDGKFKAKSAGHELGFVAGEVLLLDSEESALIEAEPHSLAIGIEIQQSAPKENDRI